jgi:GNAT superfamily N-acetyltransferase
MRTQRHRSDYSTALLAADRLEEAADLFVTNYEQARASQPLLPPCHADRAEILSKLTDLSGRERGVAVTRGRQLAGYGIAFGVDEWHSWPSVFMPEWGHAATPENRSAIYRALYGALSRQWADAGALCHLACMVADGAPLPEWQWMGFGLQCVDALRNLAPVEVAPPACEVRRAGPQDAAVAGSLMNRLSRHLADAPVFLPDADAADPDEVREQLADSDRACFVGWQNGQAVGYVSVRSANPDAGWLIQDSGTASIDGAYTLPECRGQGIATALLNAAITWARERDYVRLAVDFEAHNPPGRAFWLRHFEPVAYSVARYVRLPGANAEG